MSRCFPFPPPGYETKHILENLLALKEAKFKDKKEKRRRRHKERKKDRREKDGRGERNGDKKERHREKKEKYRDKNKDENKGKEKETSDISCLENSNFATNIEQVSGKILHPEGRRYDHLLASHSPMEAEFVMELNKRVRQDHKQAGSEIAVRNASIDAAREKVNGVELEGTGRVVDLKIHRNDDTMNEKTDKSQLVEPENVIRIRDESHINGNSSLDNESDTNMRKRKGGGINGFFHDNEIKLQSIDSSTKNGSNLIASQAPIKDQEIWLINGTVKPHNLPLSRHSALANEELDVYESKRPPHPDSKFLSQALSVPSLVEWFEYDDEEWLFSKKLDPESRRHIPEETPRLVWSKPVHIESSDVYALPYVIPY